MSHKIQVRRGLQSDLPLLDEGEIGFSLDEKRTYIGSPSGNVELVNTSQLADTALESEAIRDKLDFYTDTRTDIVVIGDSLSKGDEGQSLKGMANISDWLRFFTRYSIENNGIWGNTIDDVIGRLQTDVINLKPAFCIVLVGTNDINNGVPTNTIVNKAKVITTSLQRNKIRPIFISVPPRNDNTSLNATIREYNNKLEYFCIRNQAYFIDVYSHLAKSDGGAKTGLLSPVDNLHWVAQGAYECAKIVQDFIPLLSNYNDRMYSRFWYDTPYDNFEFATSQTVAGTGVVADSWTVLNTASATFAIEPNPKKTIDTDSNYQVINKTTNTAGIAGIKQTVFGHAPGGTYRTEFDLVWEMTGNINTDTNLRCVLTVVAGGVATYHVFVDAYNLKAASFRPFFDVDIPLNVESVTLEIYGMGTANYVLKVGRVIAYKLG